MGARKIRDGSPAQAPDQGTAKPDDLLVMASKYTGTVVKYCNIMLILDFKANNSSISSKRSVERLYYPNEPHFFRFFVKKFQRRAPLINRGYHLRLHVIDVTLRNFLRQPSPTPSSKTKVIVNLGCGRYFSLVPLRCSRPCLCPFL